MARSTCWPGNVPPRWRRAVPAASWCTVHHGRLRLCCTERPPGGCGYLTQARCRCIPVLADDHATVLQAHASNELVEQLASRPPACPTAVARSQSPAGRVAQRVEAHAACVQAPPPMPRRPPARATPREREPARPAARWRPTRARVLIAGRQLTPPVPIATKAPAWSIRALPW